MKASPQQPRAARSDRVQTLCAVVCIALGYLVAELVFGITCPIRWLTGISCAGCGMSRAWFSLLRGDWTAAAHFHPLFWLPVPGVALLWFRQHIPPRLWRAAWAAILLLAGAVYLLRLADPADLIVVWQPSDGVICRLLRAVFHQM